VLRVITIYIYTLMKILCGMQICVSRGIRHTHICIMYTPNLRLEIAVLGREREQGRFRGSSEGAGGSIEGAGGSIEGALREYRGSKREHYGAMQRRSTLEPELAPLSPPFIAFIIGMLMPIAPLFFPPSPCFN